MKTEQIIQIAKIAHEANRVYCNTIGDNTQLVWRYAPQWQIDSSIKGVKFTIDNLDAPPSGLHDSWVKEKKETGWKYGKVKDVEKKEHPCIVPYDELPEEQKKKDSLFQGVVKALL